MRDTIHISEVSITHDKSVRDKSSTCTDLDSVSLDLNRNQNLNELLNRHSTVYIKSTGRGALATASFRGTDASHTKVYWNGMIINSAMLGQTDLSLIPAAFMDQVALYHGGSSLAEGPGAIGGIIAIDNKPDWSDKSNCIFSSEIGSFGTYMVTGRMDLVKSNWISKSRLFYNYSENDYPFYNQNIIPSANERMKNAEFSRYGYLQECYYRFQTGDVFSIKFWIQHSDRNLPRPMSREGSEVKESQEDGSIRPVFTWKHYGRAGETEISSGLISDKIYYSLSEPLSDYLSIDSHSTETGFINRFDYTHRMLSKTTIRLQLLYNWYKVSISERIREEGYQASRSELSIMTSVTKDFGKRINTYLLLRSDLVDKNLIPVKPSMGIAFRLMKSQELYLKTNLTRNYNVPRLNDLYWVPGGNPELKPEQSYTGDLGIDLQLQKNSLGVNTSLTGYYSKITGWIIWKPTQYHYWAPQNVALVHSRGIELSVKAVTMIKSAKILVKANYNFCRSTDEKTGNQLIYIPVHSLNIYSGIFFKGFQLNYSILCTGKRSTLTENITGNPEGILKPYSMSDISLRKDIKLTKVGMNFQFSIMNIFDADYQVIISRPMPGRNYSFTLGVLL